MIISLKKYYILFEQGIMSLLNFSLIFLLSKLISPLLFKDFFLGYSIVIIISLITSNFANQPLQVFLKKSDNNVNYILKVLIMNTLIILLISIISFFIINAYYIFLSESLPYILILGFIVSIYDSLRRISFVYFQDNFLFNTIATLSVFITFFLLILTHYYIFDFISVNKVYLFLILGYIIGFFVFFLLKIREIKTLLFLPKSKNKLTFIDLLKKHGNYALWLVFGIIFFWIYTQGIYFLSEKYIAVDDFNAVRISQNLVGVLSILFVTFENVMLTKVVSIFNEKNFKEINQYVKKIFRKSLLPFTIILLLTGLLITVVYKIYYQNNIFYSEKIVYLGYFFTYQFIFGMTRVFVVALKAMNKTKYIFYNHLLTAVFTIVLSLFILNEHSTGHIIALIMTLSILIFSIGTYRSYKKVILKNI